MYKYIINIIGDNRKRKIVKSTTIKPEHHMEFLTNLFEQWYDTYEIISIEIHSI